MGEEQVLYKVKKSSLSGIYREVDLEPQDLTESPRLAFVLENLHV